MVTAKQQKFCMQFIVDYSPKDAAIRAGYSPKTAVVQSSVLLKNPTIQAEIRRLSSAAAEKVEVTPDTLVRKLMEIVSMDASDVRDSPLKYANQLKAIDFLGRYWRMWDNGAKVNVNNVMARVDAEHMDMTDVANLPDDQLRQLASALYQDAPIALPAVEVVDCDYTGDGASSSGTESTSAQKIR